MLKNKKQFFLGFSKNFPQAKGLIIVTNALMFGKSGKNNSNVYSASKIDEFVKKIKKELKTSLISKLSESGRTETREKQIFHSDCAFFPFRKEKFLNSLNSRLQSAIDQTKEETEFIDICNIDFFEENAIEAYFDPSIPISIQFSALSEALHDNCFSIPTYKINKDFVLELRHHYSSIPLLSESELCSLKSSLQFDWTIILSQLLRDQKLVIISFSRLYNKLKSQQIPKWGTKEFDDYEQALEMGVFSEESKADYNKPTMQNGFLEFQKISEGIVTRNEMSYVFSEALEVLISRGIAKREEKSSEAEPLIRFVVIDSEILKQTFGKDFLGFFL